MSRASAFFQMLDDFGNMGTGAFRQKYPDCGPHEGYGYVQRKTREFRRKPAREEGDKA